jgi:hypothetical protein
MAAFHHLGRWAGCALLGLLLLLAGPAVAQERTRVDLYDARSRRQGYVIIDDQSGRIDIYDSHSRRLGYGRLAPDGRMERFDLRGRREGTAVLPPRR